MSESNKQNLNGSKSNSLDKISMEEIEVGDIIIDNVRGHISEPDSLSAKTDDISKISNDKFDSPKSCEIDKKDDDKNKNIVIYESSTSSIPEPFKLADKKTETQVQFKVDSENLSKIELVEPSFPSNSNQIKNRNEIASNVIIHRTESYSASSSKPDPKNRFNKTYIKSFAGLFRLLLILFYFAGWISLACVVKSFNGKDKNINEALRNGDIVYKLESNQDIRSAFLFFTVTGFVWSLILYVMVVFNFVHHQIFEKLPWTFIAFLSNVLWLLPIFILSILSAIKESDLRELNSSISKLSIDNIEELNLFKYNFNIGAYASAATFGFLCTIILFIDGILHALRLRANLDINYP